MLLCENKPKNDAKQAHPDDVITSVSATAAGLKTHQKVSEQTDGSIGVCLDDTTEFGDRLLQEAAPPVQQVPGRQEEGHHVSDIKLASVQVEGYACCTLAGQQSV